MKIRNAILALGLAIALSFNFTTTLSAASSIIPTIEEGVTNIIEKPMLDRGSLVIQPGSIGVVEVSLISPNGQVLWNAKTDDAIISIPVSGYPSGDYTLIASDNSNTELHRVQL